MKSMIFHNKDKAGDLRRWNRARKTKVTKVPEIWVQDEERRILSESAATLLSGQMLMDS